MVFRICMEDFSLEELSSRNFMMKKLMQTVICIYLCNLRTCYVVVIVVV